MAISCWSVQVWRESGQQPGERAACWERCCTALPTQQGGTAPTSRSSQLPSALDATCRLRAVLELHVFVMDEEGGLSHVGQRRLQGAQHS